jgi:hypothetical protein
MPKYNKKKMTRYNLLQLSLEIKVGRAILELPEKDLKKINKMILRNRENAEVQQEDHATNGL